MNIIKLLHTDAAKAIFRNLRPQVAGELDRYGYLVASYCNELAFYHKVEKELAGLDSACMDYTNNKGKTNATKHELTRARKESLELILKLAAQLKLTPASQRGTGGDGMGEIDLPG